MKHFYRDLPEAPSFGAVFTEDYFKPLPPSWFIATTDVVNSTTAIADGRYRDVTIAGTLGTIALANHLGSLDFPFFFGGDGMVFLIPPGEDGAAEDLLFQTQEMVHKMAGLDLRYAVFPAGDIFARGGVMEIGKVRVSPRYVQAVGRGSGFTMIDTRIREATKKPERHSIATADFNGFTCRWKDINSSPGSVIAIIVESTDPASIAPLETVHAILRTHLARTPGAHPVAIPQQYTTARGAGVRLEGRVKSGQRRGLRYAGSRVQMALEVMIVRTALVTGIPIRAIGKDLRAVREENQVNADIQKLDGTLKAVLSLPQRETTALLRELERLHAAGLIRYGYHQSDRAIMTCMVHVNRNDEVHFIDAADGGYAQAALMLKSQRAAAHG